MGLNSFTGSHTWECVLGLCAHSPHVCGGEKQFVVLCPPWSLPTQYSYSLPKDLILFSLVLKLYMRNIFHKALFCILLAHSENFLPQNQGSTLPKGSPQTELIRLKIRELRHALTVHSIQSCLWHPRVQVHVWETYLSTARHLASSMLHY